MAYVNQRGVATLCALMQGEASGLSEQLANLTQQAETSGSGDVRSLILQCVYPVGAIYISSKDTSPASFLGGAWEQIKDVFLLAAGDTYTLGATGGEAAVQLTVDQLPAHTHSYSKAILMAPDRQYTTDVSSYGESYGSKCYIPSKRQSIGGSQTHENRPPYKARCVWKRVA